MASRAQVNLRTADCNAPYRGATHAAAAPAHGWQDRATCTRFIGVNDPMPPLLDHDHGQCVAGAVARVEQRCIEKGLRLTPLRRNVMKALAESHAPVGAYDIVQRLADAGEPAPPMSVYRVLDFLVAEGLAHRIESRNAYLACAHPHESGEVVVFLICERCSDTREVASHAIGRDLAWAARAAGFEPRQRVLEVAGSCARCRNADEAPAGTG